MNIDHMLVDGFSYMQVFDELFNTYDRMVLGEPWELPEAAMTFGDYVRVENLRQRTQEYKNALEFQLGLFKDLPSKALLPTKRNPALSERSVFRHPRSGDPAENHRGPQRHCRRGADQPRRPAARGLLQTDERAAPSGRHDHQHAGVQPRNSISPGPARPWAASSTSSRYACRPTSTSPSSRSPARPRRSPASSLRCPSPPSSSPASCSSGRACAPRP